MTESRYWIEKNKTIDELCNRFAHNHNIVIETENTVSIKGKFDSGHIAMTHSVQEWMDKDSDEPLKVEFKHKWVNLCLLRHFVGDWGIQCLDDFNDNEFSLMDGSRLMSVYEFDKNVTSKCDNQKIWIITEWDRTTTTVLFPDDY